MNDEVSTSDLGEQLVLLQALFTIVHESSEAEIVRLAMSALTNTSAGLTYLSAHPLTV